MFERLKNAIGLGGDRGLTDAARERGYDDEPKPEQEPENAGPGVTDAGKEMGYGDEARHDAPTREERTDLARERRAQRQIDREEVLRERAEQGDEIPEWMLGPDDGPGTREEILARRERMDRELERPPDRSMIPLSLRDDLDLAQQSRDVEQINDVTGATPERDRDGDRARDPDDAREARAPEQEQDSDARDRGLSERDDERMQTFADAQQEQEPELTNEDYEEYERQKVLEREEILYEYADVSREDLASTEREEAYQELDRQEVVRREQERKNPHPLLSADDDRERDDRNQGMSDYADEQLPTFEEQQQERADGRVPAGKDPADHDREQTGSVAPDPDEIDVERDDHDRDRDRDRGRSR